MKRKTIQQMMDAPPPAPLSERVRPNSEAAPWVIEEIRELERRLANFEIVGQCAARVKGDDSMGFFIPTSGRPLSAGTVLRVYRDPPEKK
jgi:hypothetical protein